MSCAEIIDRARALRPGLRVLLASGYTANINVSELQRTHDLPLLRKPYDPDGLLRAIRDQLDKQ
jgi:hypothetical protein